MSRPLRTAGGRPLAIAGDAALITLDRLELIGRHLDADPRIASVSIEGRAGVREGWLRGTAPAGVAVVMATDSSTLTGAVADGASAAEVRVWGRAASDRGLWHDRLLLGSADVLRAPLFIETAELDVIEEGSPSSASFVVSDARRGSAALTVNVDATWLGEHETGAQVLTVAAVQALARQPGIASVTLTGLRELPPYAERLTAIPGIHIDQDPDRADIAWFPNQIDARSNIAAARDLGRRVVTTYLDLIAYDIPRYHASTESWESYRAMQRSIALSVDGITTISADVATRLLDEVPRLDAERVRPIPLGLDHVLPEHVPASAPAEVAELGDRRFILVLGNDFAHKNRDFAIAVWQELLKRGASCDLVLAGLHVRGSSSKEAEDCLLASHVDLRGRVHRLGHVSSESRAWLLANAAVVHYPSSAEGFGFVPYEAASLGTPSTFTDFGPLREISSASGLPKHWDVVEHANDIEGLLHDREHAPRRLEQLRAAIALRTWDAFAAGLTAFFDDVSGLPTAPASAVTGSSGDSARLAQILSSRSWRLMERARRVRPRRGR